MAPSPVRTRCHSSIPRIRNPHLSTTDDVGSMVQDRLDKYDLHPSPHGTEIDTEHIDNTTAREIRLLEKQYESSFAVKNEIKETMEALEAQGIVGYALEGGKGLERGGVC